MDVWILVNWLSIRIKLEISGFRSCLSITAFVWYSQNHYMVHDYVWSTETYPGTIMQFSKMGYCDGGFSMLESVLHKPLPYHTSLPIHSLCII